MAIKLKIGSPVIGEDFFGRWNELKKARDDIFNHIYAKYPSFESDDMGLLLRALMNDGYLVKDREQYRFRSPLLRDYWKETYC